MSTAQTPIKWSGRTFVLATELMNCAKVAALSSPVKVYTSRVWNLNCLPDSVVGGKWINEGMLGTRFCKDVLLAQINLRNRAAVHLLWAVQSNPARPRCPRWQSTSCLACRVASDTRPRPCWALVASRWAPLAIVKGDVLDLEHLHARLARVLLSVASEVQQQRVVARSSRCYLFQARRVESQRVQVTTFFTQRH